LIYELSTSKISQKTKRNNYEVANMLSKIWSLDGLYSHRSYIRHKTVKDINKSSLIEAIIENLETEL